MQLSLNCLEVFSQITRFRIFNLYLRPDKVGKDQPERSSGWSFVMVYNLVHCSYIPMTNIKFEQLKQRGLITNQAGGTLQEILSKKRKIYVGIEPSADSLHVGNLVPIILMKHLYDMGHTPFLLVGGGTGLIGDPKESSERPLLDQKIVTKNAKAIRNQLSRILGVDSLVVFDNATWLTKLNLIEFLRDIGKHFTVNQLIKRDIIKRRLETEEDSISYTEFSYSLLQGYDFMHLNEKHGIDLQIGGSDQWANLLSGVDLIRQKKSRQAYALTTPIVVDRSTGKKFGKSEGNAVWLDPKKTTPLSFYQFWINTSDENVEEYLRIFSFLSLKKIEAVIAKHAQSPQNRLAQRTLAEQITTFVHGAATTKSVEKVSQIIYGTKAPSALSPEDKKLIISEVPNYNVSKKLGLGVSIIDALINLDLAKSKTEARKLLEGKAVYVNGKNVDETFMFSNTDFKDKLAFIKKGKKIGVLTI